MWVCCVLVLMSYRKDSKTVLVSISVHMVGKVPQMTTAGIYVPRVSSSCSLPL